MKSHHKERMLIALGCAAGFAAVLLGERMNRGATRTAVSNPAAADIQLATVTGPAEDVVWTNAPWEWPARLVNRMKVQQFQVRRVSSGPEWVPPNPGQFDLIDFRHQPQFRLEDQ